MADVIDFKGLKVVETAKPLTYRQILEEQLAHIGEDGYVAEDVVPRAMHIVIESDTGIRIIPLTETTIYTLVGVLEAAKIAALDTLYTYEEE